MIVLGVNKFSEKFKSRKLSLDLEVNSETSELENSYLFAGTEVPHDIILIPTCLLGFITHLTSRNIAIMETLVQEGWEIFDSQGVKLFLEKPIVNILVGLGYPPTLFEVPTNIQPMNSAQFRIREDFIRNEKKDKKPIFGLNFCINFAFSDFAPRDVRVYRDTITPSELAHSYVHSHAARNRDFFTHTGMCLGTSDLGINLREFYNFRFPASNYRDIDVIMNDESSLGLKFLIGIDSEEEIKKSFRYCSDIQELKNSVAAFVRSIYQWGVSESLSGGPYIRM